MNKRMMANILGVVLLAEALLLLVPALAALIYREWRPLHGFLATAGGTAVLGAALRLIPVKRRSINANEGLVTVALCWILVCVGGAVPFCLSGEVPSALDAFFESVSGFTTTGASILTEVESLSRSILFWRSFTHWIGGMGILVFVMTVMPLAGGGNLYLLRGESPGPGVTKMVPQAKDNAKWLYVIYFALTAAEVLILLLCGNPLFDALTLSFGTTGTGGFAIRNTSLADYSGTTQVVITVFMALSAVNFNAYFLLLVKHERNFLKNEEIRTYFIILVAAALLITANIAPLYDNILVSFKHAAFQVSSIMTTTGYVSTDYGLWPQFSQNILVILMCVGACVGSTGGGLKVERLLVLLKASFNQLREAVSPGRVTVVRINGRTLTEPYVRSILGYFVLYVLILVASLFVVSLDGMDFTSNLTGVVATLNNIGPGLNAVGATGNFAGYNALSKVVFIFDMLIGRLEIIPMLLLFSFHF